ncbi:class I SAM-dependent methyltransferase [Patescibacteria group bacterium]|nr:MAG: class I SAM-dependent methyltransferase [Patescibacteria group bacterium]
MNTPQVSAEHYRRESYDHKARWLSYWYQLRAVLAGAPREVLEVGLGGGVVTRYLRERGIKVITADIDPALKPDLVASVVALPLADEAVDTAVAFEVLEHLPFADFPRALSELRRVSRREVIVSIPDSRRTLFFASVHLPGIGRKEIFIKIPSRRRHKFDGQHHWEMGKRGYPVKKILNTIAAAGLTVKKHFVPSDCPTKHFFLCRKNNPQISH